MSSLNYTQREIITETIRNWPIKTDSMELLRQLEKLAKRILDSKDEFVVGQDEVHTTIQDEEGEG